MALGSWLLALGSRLLGVSPCYLSAWGAGSGQLATMWPELLHLQTVIIRRLLIYHKQGTDLWQVLVGLVPPLAPPNPLLP